MEQTNHPPKTLKEVLSIFFEVDDEVVADFEQRCTLVSIKKNKHAVSQGEVFRDIIIIRSGLMRIRHESDGAEDTLLFGSSGDVYASIHSFFSSKPSLYSLTSVSDAEYWVLKYDDWLELERRHPVLTRWMRDLLLEQLQSLEEHYLRFKTKSIEELFLNFLNTDKADIPRRPSIKTINRIVPLKYIAQYLSITPESLSRLRNKLVRRTLKMERDAKKTDAKKNTGKPAKH